MLQEEWAVTSVLMRGWGIQNTQQNPPNLRGLPHSLQYVTQYSMEQAYVTPRADKETTRHYKQRVYITIKALQQNSKDN
jgi:hypothetical protein